MRKAKAIAALLLLAGSAQASFASGFELLNSTEFKARVYFECHDPGEHRGKTLDPLIHSGSRLQPGVIFPGIPMRSGGGPIYRGRVSCERIDSISKIVITEYGENNGGKEVEINQAPFLQEPPSRQIAILVPETADLIRNPPDNPHNAIIQKGVPVALDPQGRYELVKKDGGFEIRRQ